MMFWIPRVLSVSLAAFLSLFAFDDFTPGQSGSSKATAFFIHLLPAAVVLGALVIAWRREWFGALFFLGFASWYALKNLAHPSWILVIAGPAFLIGSLFLLNWICFRKPKATAR